MAIILLTFDNLTYFGKATNLSVSQSAQQTVSWGWEWGGGGGMGAPILPINLNFYVFCDISMILTNGFRIIMYFIIDCTREIYIVCAYCIGVVGILCCTTLVKAPEYAITQQFCENDINKASSEGLVVPIMCDIYTILLC